MEVSLKIADDAKQWDTLLARASYRTIFHTWKWLKIVEKDTNTKLYPLIGFKGTDPIGIFPLFYQKKGFLKIVLSPPKQSAPYLGPLIIDYESMKQGKRESTLFEFLKAVDHFIFSELKCTHSRIRSSSGLLDSRPFLWNGYEVEPMYTLILDLGKNLDDIWESFDKVLRKNINGTLKERVSVEEGSIEDLDFLHSSIIKRLKEKGFEQSKNKSYLYDIFKSFFPQNLRIFIAKYEGERVGGLLVTSYDNKVSALFGTPKITMKGIYPNDLIHWEAIKLAKENGFRYYELVDTGEFQRLCTYKSQFNPNLSVWFSATKYSSRSVKFIQKSYTLARKKLT